MHTLDLYNTEVSQEYMRSLRVNVDVLTGFYTELVRALQRLIGKNLALCCRVPQRINIGVFVLHSA